jgi:hypothetical protein
MNMRPFIGSKRIAREVKRQKGIRLRRNIWISKNRDVEVITGMDNSHLFFVAKLLMGYADTARWDAIMKHDKGKDRWGQPLSPGECARRKSYLEKAKPKDLALEEYGIFCDVLNELEKRGKDPNNPKDAEEARRETQQIVRRYGKL